MPTCLHGWGSDGMTPSGCPECAAIGRQRDKDELSRLRPIVAAAKAWAVSRRLDVDPMPSDAAKRRYETAEALVAALANGGEL